MTTKLDTYLESLYQQRDRVVHAIESLEEIVRTGESAKRQLLERAPGKRGRKFMGIAERQIVSERMRRYWAKRREEKHDQEHSR